MQNKYTHKLNRIAFLFTCILMGVLLFCTAKKTALAEEKEEAFFVDAQTVPSNDDTYTLQISVESKLADWEGIVRVIARADYQLGTAYDMMISLPQGNRKQFSLKIPKDSAEGLDADITVLFVDDKDRTVSRQVFRGVLSDDSNIITMGILSDSYTSLTYLDMGGQSIYFNGKNYPIKLSEVTKDDLVDNLDALNVLVIDNYNTEVLTDEVETAILDWIYAGGALLVGTGEYAEDTLPGLDICIWGVECTKIHEPYDDRDAGYFLGLADSMDAFHMAELRDKKGHWNIQYFGGAFMEQNGSGVISIFPYSFQELGEMTGELIYGMEKSEYVRSTLEETMANVQSQYYGGYYYNDRPWIQKNMLRMMGSVSSKLYFGVLRVVVILYVIFVGPILYLILRKVNKKELYWIAVPVTTLVGILLVFLCGRGFEVVDTEAYTLMLKDVSGKQKDVAYIYAFDSGHKEWDIRLQSDFAYASPFCNDDYMYSSEEDAYYYRICREGDRISVGLNPSSGFEDSYYMAVKSTNDENALGAITAELDDDAYDYLLGRVTNNSDIDFIHFAVVYNDTLYVYDNLMAGETCDLSARKPIYTAYSGSNMWSNYQYSRLWSEESVSAEEAASAAALGAALCTVYPENDNNVIVIMGTAKSTENIIDDKCSEKAYECLYVIQ